MFVGPSSVLLNTNPPASGAIPGKAYPFPGLLPLSTPLAPTPNQTSTPPSSYTSFFLDLGSPPLPSTMPLSGVPVSTYSLSVFGVNSPSSGPSSTVSTSASSPRSTTGAATSAGTSLPPSIPVSSNSDVSASPTPWSAASETTSSTISSSGSLFHSTNSPSTSGLTFTSMSMPTPPFSETSATQTSSPASDSSYLSTHSTTSPLSSSVVTDPSTSSLAYTTTRSPVSTIAIVFSTTLVTSVSLPPSSYLSPPSTSIYTITSVVLGQGVTATDFVTTSNVLSTKVPGGTLNSTVSPSPGTIAAIVLGIIGAVAFSALWLFCARRRHRRLMGEATLVSSENHAPGPLVDEILDVEELGYGIEGSTLTTGSPMNQASTLTEHRHTGILATLHSMEGFGRGDEGGSTSGVYGSRHDTTTDIDEGDNVTRTPSPTLPLHVMPAVGSPYMVPLSPPPPVSQPLSHSATQPVPPPSSYYMASRRKSSPGPDPTAWLHGYSVAPSCTSHYARSQTLGSGSGSGSVDALTRTRTGSEEPLLGIGKATQEVAAGASTPEGISPLPGLGSAFGSPAASLHSPGSVYPALQYDASGSHDTRTVSGSGSYGYTRSVTPSSFDVLRSVSSQGALSSSYSQGHGQGLGFKLGFNRQGSLSSGSTGKRTGSNRYSFGVAPTSFRAWKDRGSAASDKEKQSLREKHGILRPQSSTSASTSGSVDEKQGRGSPVLGVRALLGRLRRAGHTPSPRSSNKDLPSPTGASMDVDLEKGAVDRVTPPPIQVRAATPHRRRFSFILSNPDPHPPSPYSGAGTPPRTEPGPTQPNVSMRDPRDPFSNGGGLLPPTPFPTGYMLAPTPSPVPTEESRLADGLLHPRLRAQGHSDASLRDFEDYSRPIGGVVKNRLYSTTTFATQDDPDRTPSGGTPVQSDEHEHENDVVDVFGTSTIRSVPRESWFDLHSPPAETRRSPDGL